MFMDYTLTLVTFMTCATFYIRASQANLKLKQLTLKTLTT